MARDGSQIIRVMRDRAWLMTIGNPLLNPPGGLFQRGAYLRGGAYLL